MKENHFMGNRTVLTSVMTEQKSSAFNRRSCSALIELSKNFGELSRPSLKDISIFKEQFYTLILKTTAQERQQVASHLARSEYVPKAIVIFLVMEEIAIARQPLLMSPVLQPGDLNMMIGKVSLSHLKVMAERDHLSEENVQRLLEVDTDTDIIKSILEKNPNCTFNLNTSFQSHQQELQSASDRSTDITTSFNLEQETGQTEKRATKDLSEALLKLANRGSRLSRKPTGKPEKPAIAPLNKKQIERQLLEHARSKNLTGFAVSVQHFCNLKESITNDLLKRQDAGMLATLLCALEVSEITAARILLMLNRNIGRNAQILRIVMNKYSNLNFDECVSFYEKYGATFRGTVGVTKLNPKSTRYALSSVARERRAELLKKQKEQNTGFYQDKLSA